jgi:hypothetical protein
MSDPEQRFPKIMDELPPVEISREFVLRCAENQAAIDYWRSKCRGRTMPERSDIDPTEMRAFLTNVGLIETPDGSPARPDYRIALAGSAIEAVLGPLTGRLLQEAVSPVIARRWRSVYEVVVREAVPIRAVSQVSFEAKNFLMAEFLVMPLSRAARPVDMLFASLAFWSGAPE